MTSFMEGLQAIHLVVDGGVARIAFGAFPGHVGDTIHGVCIGHQPSTILDHREHVLA